MEPLPEPARDRFDPTFVPPRGCASKPRLYIVGEAPGEEEVRQRKPFVGRAGRILDRLIAAAGIDASEIRFFNAVPFRPITRGESGAARNRAPTRREIRRYSTVLFDDIRRTAPRAILAVGKAAMTAFGIDRTLKEARDEEFRFEGTPVTVTYHPQYVEYSGGQGSEVWKQTVSDLRSSWQSAGD